ncbi:MAG TPA: ABC transporter permease subunit [Paenibacillus sp.]|nr:ABC transporter permease subunit [Paenibacillus sp.]
MTRLGFLRSLTRYQALYLMLIPGVLYFLTFKYAPLLGSIIAFKDYHIAKGIIDSPWVGFRWFENLFTYPQFTRLLRNTLLISVYQIIFSFPAPIILALLLNELRKAMFKRLVQTVIYLPHFLSWTLMYGLVYMMFSVQTGVVNNLLGQLGIPPINLLQSNEIFRTLIVGSGMWKEMGWGTIIFLAALTGINPSLYEAARIDGAGRWNQMRYISLPGIMPAVVVLLLLKLGNILDLGFEQIFIFLNPTNYENGDILDTYAYRAGIIQGQYSMTTAIGLFQSVIGFLLLLFANRLSNKTTGEGLF